jgi:uncharacterized membrane protein YhaH (DUF805 family)
LAVAGTVVLMGKRERRLAWKLCLWLGIAATTLLTVLTIPILVLGSGWVGLPEALAIWLLLVGVFPTTSFMAWRRLHSSAKQRLLGNGGATR